MFFCFAVIVYILSSVTYCFKRFSGIFSYRCPGDASIFKFSILKNGTSIGLSWLLFSRIYSIPRQYAHRDGYFTSAVVIEDENIVLCIHGVSIARSIDYIKYEAALIK